MRIAWRPQCARVAAALEALQVELHGHYSVERFDAFKHYKQSTPCVCIAVVLLLTPLPCLVAIIGADLLPLEPPHTGREHNHTFWLRAYAGVWIFTLSFVHQFHYTLPTIPMSTRQIWAISAVVSTGGLGCSYVTALAVGFPVPFMMVTCSPGWALLLVLAPRWSWRPFLKHPSVLGAVKNCIRIFLIQMAMIIVYPAYSYVFAQLASYQQTLFSVVLQLIKLASKLPISEIVCAADDLQPEVVILNADVFHTLFVAVCLHNASSVTTSIVLLAVDALAACLAAYDVNKTVRKLHALSDEIDHVRAASLATVNASVPEVLGTATAAVDNVEAATPSSDDTAASESSTETEGPAARVFVRHEIVERAAAILERNDITRSNSRACKPGFAWFEARSSNRIAPSVNEPHESTRSKPSQRPSPAGWKVVPITAATTSNSTVVEEALEHTHTGAHALKPQAILPDTPS